MRTDPAIEVDDLEFVAFVRECESIVARGDPVIPTRDAVAARAGALASRWRMPHQDFRRLQDGAPYSSYQLYLNPPETLSVVLDIFAPGQVAPIHNHRCWGVFVVLEGEELERCYAVEEDLASAPVEQHVTRNGPGVVSVGDPVRNAFHQVECVGEVPAISLHVYGANIKALVRDRWDDASQRFVTFQSGADPRRRQAAHYLTPDGLRGA